MPGIKDVARRAGVGVATVSRVINNSGYVSEETKDKIEKAITECPAYDGNNIKIHRVFSMEEAVKKASDIAVEGDVVTLSPACASFDLYPNFEARGIHYKNIVKGL